MATLKLFVTSQSLATWPAAGLNLLYNTGNTPELPVSGDSITIARGTTK